MNLTEPIMRPPQEAASLVLQATQGCTWNKCNFCHVSRGYNFLAKKPGDLAREAEAAAGFFRPDTRIYLAGSNPFALPTRKLKEYIAALRGAFPNFERLSMQTRVDDISRKSGAELRELRELGLKHLYMGVENGSEEVLRLMDKGHTAEDTAREMRRLDEAGVTYTVFYVLGLGGKGAGEAAARATAAMLNRGRPERVTTTGMTIFPDTPLAAMRDSGEYVEASEREKIEELRTFLTNLEGDIIYDGRHYLNPLNYRFVNRDEAAKKRVLADIDEVLASYSDAELELMVSRKNMRSL